MVPPYLKLLTRPLPRLLTAALPSVTSPGKYDRRGFSIRVALVLSSRGRCYYPSTRESVHSSHNSCTLHPHFRTDSPKKYRKVCTVPTIHAHSPPISGQTPQKIPESVHSSLDSCTLHPHFRTDSPKNTGKCAQFPRFMHTSPPFPDRLPKNTGKCAQFPRFMHASPPPFPDRLPQKTLESVHSSHDSCTLPPPKKKRGRHPPASPLRDVSMHAPACTLPRDVKSERQRERPGAESSDSEIRSAKGRRSQRSGDRMPLGAVGDSRLGVDSSRNATAMPLFYDKSLRLA